MIPNIYIVENELTSPQFGRAFADGCGAEHKFILDHKYTPGPWAGFLSPKNWQSLQDTIAAGFDYYYGDHGYFGRGTFYRVTKNAPQYYGESNPNYNRLKPFYDAVKPWRKEGKHIIVCPQSENHHERFGQPNWLDNTLKILRASTDRKIKVRYKKDWRPLGADLINAHALVTHTSNAAVESVLAGVPVICTGLCAASQYGIKDLTQVDNVITPDGDRLRWAATLANNQWSLQEISDGKCWEKIK